MTKAQFTFCIPNLNKIDFLPACINSMLVQDCQAWRCVFVDGYSTDGSWEYMQQFANDPRFTLLRGKRQGMYADWNYCLEQVNTEYFYFLTSDDLCYPQLVSKTTRALDHCPDIDACHFKFDYINEYDQITRTYTDIIASEMPIYLDASNYAHRRAALFEFLMHCVYRTIYRTMTSLVLRRSLISQVGPFSTQVGSAGDYDWTMRLTMHTDTLFIPETLTAWRKYEGQATQSPHSVGNNRRIFEIAKANLCQIQQGSEASSFGPALDPTLTLSFLSRDYEFALYNQIHQATNIANALDALLQATQAFPLHYLQALLKRLGLSSRQSCLTKNVLAKQLIQNNQLQWPPLPLKLSSTEDTTPSTQATR
ncbi:glycosyltransferase family A protein [Leptolyngbya sp. KIOST-1]|uniref:glycosyltransferase family A protein n=1 Tax=Leptolyngbya sp. KIOST-1 TaxID=1229172 RepID=UPI000564815B|nr:glycosyltransferase family A protein [Leptolyngbya sp. KIOST-1]